MNNQTGDKWLGLIAILFALLLVLVWIPLDTDTGLLEKVRRQVTLGDALGPTIAGVVILIGGVMTFMRPNMNAPTLAHHNLKWMAQLFVTVGLSIAIMRYAGPIVTSLFTDQPYRVLRATPPWNYIGYLMGGTVLVATLISIVRGKIGLSPILIGFVASLIIALLYDVPFDNLQLPPNGDV